MGRKRTEDGRQTFHGFISRKENEGNMSSNAARLVFDPSMMVSRALLMIMVGYVVASPLLQTMLIVRQLTAGQVTNMIYGPEISTTIVWGLVVFGVLLGTFIFSYYRYYNKQKHDGAMSFDVPYIISVVLTAVLGVIVGGIVAFDGIALVGDGIQLSTALSILVLVLVGGLSAFIVNILIFDPLANGTVARGLVKADEIAKELLLAEETKKAVFQAVAKKCTEAGLVDKEAIDKIASIVQSSDDSVLSDLIDYYLAKQKSAEPAK